MNYIKDGVGYSVRSIKDLEQVLNDITFNRYFVDKTLYAKYVKNHAYAIDGKSSKRCLNIINEISKN